MAAILNVSGPQAATLTAATALDNASKNLDEIVKQVNARAPGNAMPMSDAIALAQLQVDFARGMIELANRL